MAKKTHTQIILETLRRVLGDELSKKEINILFKAADNALRREDLIKNLSKQSTAMQRELRWHCNVDRNTLIEAKGDTSEMRDILKSHIQRERLICEENKMLRAAVKGLKKELEEYRP